MLTILNSLDDDLKKQVIAQLSERGVWPSNVSYSKMIRRLEDFVNVVIEGQQLRMETERKAREHEEKNNAKQCKRRRKDEKEE